jgi:hypothetical protein
MKRKLPVFTALAMSLMSSALIGSLNASDIDRKTTITISQPVAVEGTILPAGQYVLKLQDSGPTQDVVKIFNSEETHLISTIMPIHAYRQQPTEKSEFSFYDSAAGQPPALRTWYYPGDPDGFEFLQPRHTVVADSNSAIAAAKKNSARLPQPTVATEPSMADR